MTSRYPFMFFGHKFQVTLKTLLIGVSAKMLWALMILVGSLIGMYHFGNEYLSHSGLLLVGIYLLVFMTFKSNNKSYGILSEHNSIIRKFSWIISYTFFVYALI